MICTNCGSEVPDTAKVCGHCGHRLREVQIPVLPPVLQQEPVPKNKTWIWIVLGIGGFLCLIAVLVIAAVIFIPININLGTEPIPPATQIPVYIPPPTATTVIVVQPSATKVPTKSPSPTPKPPTITFEPWRQGDTAKGLYDLGTENPPKTWVVNISANTPVMISQGWCATTQAILQQNLPNLQIKIFLDGDEVTGSLPWLSWTNNKGWSCRSHRAVIRSWPIGRYNIIYQIILSQRINDGEKDYEGAIIHTFNINVSP
jgi:hypothetical protein